MSKSTPKSKTCDKKNGTKSVKDLDQDLDDDSDSDSELCDIRETDYNVSHCNDTTIVYDSDTDMHIVRETESDCEDNYEDELDKHNTTKRIMESYDSDC